MNKGEGNTFTKFISTARALTWPITMQNKPHILSGVKLSHLSAADGGNIQAAGHWSTTSLPDYGCFMGLLEADERKESLSVSKQAMPMPGGECIGSH